MLAEELILFLIWITPVIAVILTFHKFYLLKELRDKKNLHIHFKLLGLYSNDHIQSTNSVTKREFMVLANKLTVLTYLCLVPMLIFLMVELVESIKALADSI